MSRSERPKEWWEDSGKLGWPVACGAALLGVGGWLATRVIVCRSSEVLVRTGWWLRGIDRARGMSITRTGVLLPFQTAARISLRPIHFEVHHHSITAERVNFKGPINVTIAPYSPFNTVADLPSPSSSSPASASASATASGKGRSEPEGAPVSLELFTQFATRCQGMSEPQIIDQIKPVLQNELRALFGGVTYEMLWSKRAEFREKITAALQQDLLPFGLHVINIGIGDMQDAEGSNFLQRQSDKARAQVDADAQVRVADFKKEGAIGEAQRQSDQRQQVIQHLTKALVVENEQKATQAESEKTLAVARAAYGRATETAAVEAETAVAQRAAELQRALEMARSQQNVERERADRLTAATVDAEVTVAKARGAADAVRLEAEAKLEAARKEAEGTQAKLEAEAAGYAQIVQALAASPFPALTEFYLGNKFGLYPTLAKHQAEALLNLKPQLTVNTWGADATPAMRAVQNLGQALGPLTATLEQQGVLRAVRDLIHAPSPPPASTGPTTSAAPNA